LNPGILRVLGEEGILAKRAGAYKGEKRRKELARQKKQEERRKKRLQRGDQDLPETDNVEPEETEPSNPQLDTPSGETTSD
jgi:hypothetical protein